MRTRLLLSGALLATLATTAQVNTTVPKLSPLTRHYLHELKKNEGRLEQGYIYNKAAGRTYISALIKVSDPATAQAGLSTLDARVGTRAGKIWTVKVPVENVIPFTRLSGISYIQLDEPVQPNLDMARKTTRTDSAQAGYDLPKGYSGKGVVMGVIDFGFDYNHPTFYDTTGSTYRIKRVWEMQTPGTPPPGYSYGKEITDTTAIKAQGTDNAVQFHGTSTTGMAAGSGYGSNTNSRFRGMAYASDIALVGVRRDSIGGQWMEGSFSDFLDGVNYIFNYASSVGKPAVVNISWGSQSGSHDGTSLFNQACDSLTGVGKIVVMSAGNEGQEAIHLSKTFTPTDTVIKTYLTFSPTTYQRTWVDIWGQPGKTFCGSATLYHNGVAGQTTGYVCINDTVTDMYLIADNGLDTCFVEFITSSAEENGKPRTTINIFNHATDSVGIAVKGTDGTIDMWDEYYYYGFPHGFQSAFNRLGDPVAVSGNTITTVSDMGSANSVLLVGAYASKVAYTDINGAGHTYSGYVAANRLVPFSSRGPMIDGRIKPDITAPGLTIATSMSSYDTAYTETGTQASGVVSKTTFNGHNYYYAEFSGTSASSPAAAGIVALLLEARPDFAPADVKNVIFQTAITDGSTGVLPAAGTNAWGHGKINAYGALKMAVAHTAVPYYNAGVLDCALFPNPNNGSFTVDYNGDRNDNLTIYIYNAAGALVNLKPWAIAPGHNRNTIQMADAAKGMYVVKVTSLQGSKEFKTIVQ